MSGTRRIRRVARAAWVAAFLALGTSAAARAQPAPARLPRQVYIVWGDQTPRERETVMARLDRLEDIFLQVPELGSPQGFELSVIASGGSRPMGPDKTVMADAVVEIVWRLLFHVPSRAASPEGSGHIEVRVNPVPGSFLDYVDREGRAIYIEMVRGAPLPLATQVYGELSPVIGCRCFARVVLTSGGELPWKPVSREEFYQATINGFVGVDGETLAELRAKVATTPYQDWMAGAEQRRREREETLRMLASVQTPAELAASRQTLEDTERMMTEQLRAAEAEHAELGRRTVEGFESTVEAIRAELAAMTPEERAMPALIDNSLREGPQATGWLMGPEDGPGVWRILFPDYDFWRARRSPVEVRSITVDFGLRAPRVDARVHEAVWQTFNKVDWSALNALLEVPR